LTPEQKQQLAGKTAHGKAHQKMLNEEAARIRRERAADKPKPSAEYAGLVNGLIFGGRSPYSGMMQALAGVTDLTDEGKRPIDLTNVSPTLDCGTFGEIEAKSETAVAVTDQNVPASNSATNANPKGGSDVAHGAVQTHESPRGVEPSKKK